MYSFYIAGVKLPVPPESMTIDIGGKNEVVTLIDEGEINIIKGKPLKDFSFDILLPQVKYPFAKYENAYTAPGGNTFDIIPPLHYLELFAQLKDEKLPFQLDIYRELPSGEDTWYTNETVTLEEYTVTESADNGFDVQVSLRFKEYKQYGTQQVILDDDGVTYITIRSSDKSIQRVSEVRANETLVEWCQRNFGYSTDELVWYIYAINKNTIDAYNYGKDGISPLTVYEGEKLKTTDENYKGLQDYALTSQDAYNQVYSWLASTGSIEALANYIPTGDLTATMEYGGQEMTQYEVLNARLTALESKNIYNTVDSVPTYAHDLIEYMVSQNWIKGTSSDASSDNLGLTDDMLRILVICARAGAFGDEAVAYVNPLTD